MDNKLQEEIKKSKEEALTKKEELQLAVIVFIPTIVSGMRYTGPKMKLCRREQKNLFWPTKYNIDKNTSLPGKSGRAMVRLSEYGKLLRNKQVLKRMYQMSEKQFPLEPEDQSVR